MDNVGFFDSFMPHGMCYLWYPHILVLHVASDAFIAISYFCIPIALFYFFRNRTDFPFRNVILMFSIFIFTCGLSHIMGIWTVWNGAYGVQGLVKGATAVASLATAAMLVPVMPQLLALRSPRDLELANVALTDEIDKRVRSEKRAQQLVESAPDAILIVDREQVIQVVNSQAEAMFEIKRKDLVGQSLKAIIPGGGPKSLSAEVTAFVANRRGKASRSAREFFGRRKDSSEFAIEVSLSEVGSPDQELFSLAIRDVSERRELELQTKALEQQIAHVDRLDTMGQMAAGLAHEINQPLAALAQNADSALMLSDLQNTISPELKEILQDIEAQAHRAGEIIRALRQFIGNDDASRAMFKLDELALQTLRLTDNDAKKNGIEVMSEINKPTNVFGVRVQVAQVMLNLIRNSIEALVEAGTKNPRISISATKISDFLTVSVEDNGPGFSKEQDLFIPFQSGKIDGLGMGLSICKSIIEGHGGTLTVDTKLEFGSRISFTLPMTGPAE